MATKLNEKKKRSERNYLPDPDSLYSEGRLDKTTTE